MKVKTILITSDDGYNAVGVRTLIYYLKHKYSLHIAATKSQQSGVGGKISLGHSVHWDKITVDGIKGIYVDGTPCDAIECASAYYKNPFDLVISGINLGVNIGGTFISSGTISAAHRALVLRLTKHAMALSLHVVDISHYLKTHDGAEDIREYVKYPGKAASDLINLAVENEFWSTSFLNINFPSKPSKKVRFTKPLPYLTDFYNYPLNLDYKNNEFVYPYEVKPIEENIEYDASAVLHEYISVTPCKFDYLDEKIYRRIRKRKLTID